MSTGSIAVDPGLCRQAKIVLNVKRTVDRFVDQLKIMGHFPVQRRAPALRRITVQFVGQYCGAAYSVDPAKRSTSWASPGLIHNLWKPVLHAARFHTRSNIEGMNLQKAIGTHVSAFVSLSQFFIESRVFVSLRDTHKVGSVLSYSCENSVP